MSDMSAPLKTIEGFGDIAAVMRTIGANARAAGRILATAPADQKNSALRAMAEAVRAAAPAILMANKEDVADAKKNRMAAAFIDRLTLDQNHVSAIADGIDLIATLADPV